MDGTKIDEAEIIRRHEEREAKKREASMKDLGIDSQARRLSTASAMQGESLHNYKGPG